MLLVGQLTLSFHFWPLAEFAIHEIDDVILLNGGVA